MPPLLKEERPGKFLLLPGASIPPTFISQVLGLRLTLSAHNDLLLYKLATGERLLSDAEARRVAEERVSDAEERAAQVAAENAKLRAELARLRGETPMHP